jgi:hypothetical protein
VAGRGIADSAVIADNADNAVIADSAGKSVYL